MKFVMLTLALLRGRDRIETTDADVYYDERLAARIDYEGPEISAVQFEVVFLARGSSSDPDVSLTADESEFVTSFETLLEAKDAECDESGRLCWTPEIYLRRPHFERSTSEVVVEFSAVAVGIKPPVEHHDPVLPSLQPVGRPSEFSALLEVFPQQKLGKPSRSDSVAGNSPSPIAAPIEAERQTLRVRVDSSLLLKLQTVRPPKEAERDTLIAQVTLECPETLLCGIEVGNVTLDMNSSGTFSALGEVKMPLKLPCGGECAFSYNLDAIVTLGYRRELVVSVQHVVLDDRAPAIIETSWTSVVDFDDIKGPLPKTPMLNSTPRMGSDIDVLSVRSVPRSGLSGITLTLTGPNKVALGEEFEWKIIAVNRSHRSRKLCIFFHSKEPYRPPPVRTDERPLVAELPALRQRVSMNSEALNADCGVIALSNELRIGLMAPHSSFESKIKLKALSPGLHSVTGSAVVDLVTGESYDTGELLNVIVE